MRDSLTIGNVTINPQFFALLKQTSFYVGYMIRFRTVILFGSDGDMGHPLLSIVDVDSQTARRLAEKLELSETDRNERIVIWGKR